MVWRVCSCLVSCEEREPFSAIDSIVITLNPGPTSMQTGDSLQFTASVTGADDPSVTWSVIPRDFGEITPNGLFRAVDVIGNDSVTVRITATSVENTGVYQTVMLTVIQKIDKSVVPDEGSLFFYSFYNIDTSGQKEEGSDRTWTWIVKDCGLTIDGRQNVVLMERDDGTLQYYHYSDNGDFSLGYEATPLIWRRYPVVSRDWITIDSVYEKRPGGVEFRNTETTLFSGLAQYEVNGKDFLAIKTKNMYSESRTGTEWYQLSSTRVYWYVPELGVVVRIEGTADYSDYEGDTFVFGDRTWMTSYQ